MPGYGGGDEGAMGEGFGDYLAASFNAALAVAADDDPACLADWDATYYEVAEAACLRRIDGAQALSRADSRSTRSTTTARCGRAR